MVTHSFVPQVNDSKNNDNDDDDDDDDDECDYHSCRNVDNDQARALYLASKQRTQTNTKFSPDSKSITKMRKYSKH